MKSVRSTRSMERARSIGRSFARRPAGVGLLALTAALICLLGSLGGGLFATGNLEIITLGGTAIGNRAWNDASLPIRWFYHDPLGIPATCNYVSANAPAATLQPAHAAAFAAWENLPDSRLSFVYGGTTTVRNVGADGVNVVSFCDAGVLASNLGFVASTPSTALTVPVTVTAGGPCPPGQGLITATICFPAGTYPAGTMIDSDIRYNTFGTTEQRLSTNNTTPGSLDVQAIATHEQGHFFGLSHDPLLQAVMYPLVDDVPASDGIGQRVPKASDVSASAHYYPEPSFGANYGSITGRITLNGAGADGVHVVAIDPATMLGVAGKFSISRFEDPAALGSEGPDAAAHGPGFYRIDGLPPGGYYVYVEYFENSEFVSTRLLNRYNSTVGNSNVSNGNTGSGGQVSSWLGFIPALAEFFDAGESGNGGDGIDPGTAADNSDVATLVNVQAGLETSGIDIAINIEPVNGQTPANRQNPTTRAVLPNDLFQGSDRITGFLLNGGTDDFYAIRYPAALLPAPPYNVAEGLWARGGRNTANMVTRLVYGSPASPALPDLDNPVLAPAGRLLTGGPGGKTAAADFIDVRDQWNVTINDARDVWIVVNQPQAPAGTALLTQGFFVLVARTSTGAARVGRTLLSQNGGATWGTLTADVFYDLITEADSPVMITSTTPVAREEGERAEVIVNGTGFANGATVDFGPGITVNSVTSLGPHQLQCSVKIADTGATAARAVNVTVTNPGAVFPNVSRVFTVQPSTNRQPVALAAAQNPVECTSPAGAVVALDGTGSRDLDSSAGTNDDIVMFEWLEDFGAASETLLGTGQSLSVPMSLGTHAITIRVTDTHDATDTDSIDVVVEDTTPPDIMASLTPQTLWPPNHMMVSIEALVTASDLCGGTTATLTSASSSEPDDAQGGGDGNTVMDVHNASSGAADYSFSLRAERQGAGTGRVYAVTYTAIDESGNAATASAGATVPHSENGVTEPLVLSVQESTQGTVVDWQPVPGALYYNVIKGRVADIADAGPFYDLGSVFCLKALSLEPTTADRADAESPAPGEAFFYLVEYNDGWGHSFGTEEASKPHVPGSGSCESSP